MNVPNAGLVRVFAAGAVAVLLSQGWPFQGGVVVAYAAAGLAVAYGALLALGRPRIILRGGIWRTVTDSVFVSALVAATGGGGSPFFPLYLLAALQVIRIGAPAGALAGAAALVGGYVTAAAAASVGPGSLIPSAVAPRAGLLALACAVCLSLSSEIRRGRSEVGALSSDLAAERSLVERDGLLLSRFGLALRTLSLEATLQWAVEAAHAVTGAPYAHVAALEGNQHRTVFEGDADACPSWSHPQVQRLVLWSCREGKTLHREEAIPGFGGLTAVPLGATGREKWGAIVVGGKSLSVAEERALERLGAALAPALERSDDTLGGVDGPSGLPNKESLLRFLRRELARGRKPAVLAVGPDGGRSLGRGVPRWQAFLGGGRGRAFRYEEDVCVVVADVSGEGAARDSAFAIRRRFSGEIRGAEGRAPAVAVGFALAEEADEDPGTLLARALRALEDALGRPEKVAGPRSGGAVSAASPEGVVRVLVAAMEARDPYLVGHAEGVSRIAGLIGREMHLPQDQMDALVTGALLHDIGKIAIPDGILLKPGPLTAAEYQTIKRHPEAGAGIVAPLEELAPVIAAIRHHHERFDGGGYPDRLRGHNIPLAARVVCVADAFDTMTRERRYARRSTVATARQEIQDGAGTQFDPWIVAAFMRATAERRANPAG